MSPHQAGGKALSVTELGRGAALSEASTYIHSNPGPLALWPLGGHGDTPLPQTSGVVWEQGGSAEGASGNVRWAEGAAAGAYGLPFTSSFV